MQLNISGKLMLAFLGLTLIVLMATLGLARWSFNQGFLDYVNALEQDRLTRLSSRVARVYDQGGRDWNIIGRTAVNRLLSPAGSRRLANPERIRMNDLPPFPAFGDDHSPPKPERRPPHKDKPVNDAEPAQNRTKTNADDKSNRPPKRPRPRLSPGTLPGHEYPPTALFNVQGEHLGGIQLDPAADDIIEVPVLFNDETIAILKSEPRRKIDSVQETAFSRQQWMTSIVIGFASLALAALVAWILTKLLLAPVRRIIRGVHRLSAGDYDVRLEGSQDEFGRIMSDINHLSTTLNKNRTSRRRWLADISHELRTPLAILTGEIEALKDGIRPFDREQVESLDQEVQRLRHLTDDLYQLSLSDIGGLRYEYLPLQLDKTLQEVVDEHRLSANKNAITLSITQCKPVRIYADHTRIEQLLTNLLRNSLAYTNSGGTISVSLRVKRKQAIVKVSDTPPGVTQEECDDLFEPLYRKDDSRSRRSEGAGLGLAICRNIVEAHRGSITAAPSTEGGLEITITLPILEA